MGSVNIINKCARTMDEVTDNSVHLTVTSPPYFSIKDYEDDRQIGYGKTYREYICDLKQVFTEIKRVTKPGGKFCLNIGDQYMRASENNGVYEIKSIISEIIPWMNSNHWIFLGNIIWRKITRTKTSGGCKFMGSMYYPRDGHITYEHEYIAIFKKPGGPISVSKQQKEQSKLTLNERSRWFRGIWDDIPPSKCKEHPATFPIEIPYRLIKMFTYAEETVLDPFMGTGTTLLAAAMLGRNSIGYDIKEEYCDIAMRRINNGI